MVDVKAGRIGGCWRDCVMSMVSVPCEEQNGIIVQSMPLMEEAGYGDIDYESILADPYRTVTAEHPHYVRLIQNVLARAKADLDRPSIADLGCGDGRFTRLLLSDPACRVVAMDISRKNLLRLKQRLQSRPEELARVVMMEGDILNPPLHGDALDVVLAVGVLLVLNKKYSEGICACARLLKPGGYLLSIDPTDLGAALYAIARSNLRELEKVVMGSTRTVDIANPDAVRYSVRRADDMVAAHKAAGLEVVEVSGVPIFPSLLFGALKQIGGVPESEWPLLKVLNDRMIEQHPGLWRTACVISRKK